MLIQNRKRNIGTVRISGLRLLKEILFSNKTSKKKIKIAGASSSELTWIFAGVTKRVINKNKKNGVSFLEKKLVKKKANTTEKII